MRYELHIHDVDKDGAEIARIGKLALDTDDSEKAWAERQRWRAAFPDRKVELYTVEEVAARVFAFAKR